MKHANFDELDALFAQADRLPGFNNFIGPVRPVKVLHQGLLPHGGADHLLWLDHVDEDRKGPGVVHLDVVHDDVVDLLETCQFLNVPDQVVLKRLLDGIHQGDLLVHDEKGVVGGALWSGIPMKVPDIPVHGTHPVDIFLDFNWLHESFPRCSEHRKPEALFSRRI